MYAEGVAIDPEKICLVEKWPEPTDLGQLRSFFVLGVLSQIRGRQLAYCLTITADDEESIEIRVDGGSTANGGDSEGEVVVTACLSDAERRRSVRPGYGRE